MLSNPNDYATFTDYKTGELIRVRKEEVMTFSQRTNSTELIVCSGVRGDYHIYMVKESWPDVFDKVFK